MLSMHTTADKLTKIYRSGLRISGKGVHMYKVVGGFALLVLSRIS